MSDSLKSLNDKKDKEVFQYFIFKITKTYN